MNFERNLSVYIPKFENGQFACHMQKITVCYNEWTSFIYRDIIVVEHLQCNLYIFQKKKSCLIFSSFFFFLLLLLNKSASMEQVYYHCAVREDEEEEQQQQLQFGAALRGRKSLQHVKDGSITTAEAPSFFSLVGEQPLPQKEEVLHTHKEQKVEETNNVAAENGNNFKDDSETVGIGVIAEIVENAINGEAISSATINDVDASQHHNSVYFDKQQGTVLSFLCFFLFFTTARFVDLNVPFYFL